MEENENNQNQQGMVRSTTNQVKNQAVKQGKKKAREKLTKEATQKVATSVAKKSALAAAAPVLSVVAIVVLVIVLAIGIASFLVTMPGLAIGELKKMAYDFGKSIASYFGAAEQRMVDEDRINILLDYLDDMGYDLKGYGFLTEYKTEADVDANGYLDEDLGVIRYKEEEVVSVDGEDVTREADSIKKAESEYLFDYLVSDNYVYTVKNFNMVTIEGENWYDKAFGVAKAIFARKFASSSFSFLYDFEEEWGEGMIALYKEKSGFGTQGDFYQNSFLGDNIEVDYDKKLLKIKRGFMGDTYEYKLDGWIGRYGVPLDFLLSLHLGTMMPDLAVDVGTSFPTEVIMLLHPQAGEDVGSTVVNENGEESEITVNTDRYIPYISRVKDHWYRDVYFVRNDEDKKDDREFVQTDLDYENVMRERWTMYETFEEGDLKGEYKLYAINSKGEYASSTADIRNYDKASDKFTQENGKYLFNGTIDEAADLELDVTKRAITVDYSDDDYDDIGWKNTNGIWTAYELKDDDSIKQTGEAIRTETNPTIKRIFSYNRYFRYDGSPDTAEAITELKKQYNIQDGALDLTYDLSNGTDELKNKKVTIESQDGNQKEFSIEDVSGKVVINQDSLNAFTMLENTNTLDADYIYRDFKELIVELGYFAKEELAEETPRLLAWPIPDTGSYGYPYRAIDKNENEFGTMIHSKGDITAAKKNNIAALLSDVPSDGESGPTNTTGNEQANIKRKSSNVAIEQIDKMQKVAVNTDYVVTKGEKNTLLASSGQFMGKDIIETAANCWKYICDRANEYEYGGTSIPVTNSSTVDCSGYVSWVIYEHGYEEFGGAQHNTYDLKNTNWNEIYGWEEIEIPAGENPMDKFKPGDIFVKHSGESDNSGVHHVTFIVEVEDDTIKTYDCGNSDFWRQSAANNYEPVDGSWFVYGDSAPGKIIRIEDINDNKVEKYKGYKGNEAVVSPVTGILLEYGTYDDSAKLKDERINVDMKYETNPLKEPGDTESESSETGTEVKDKVGYAKIMVLDAEYYKKLEVNSGSYWANDSLVNSNNTTNTAKKLVDDPDLKTTKDLSEDKDKWSDLNKTVYGYKEFAEKYETGGIAGNIVYIDGFVCQKVDPNISEKSKVEDEMPSGESIDISNYKVTDPSNKDSQMDSEYESEESYKSISKALTEKIKAENKVKKDASSSYMISADGKDLIYIKEGTVLGRTMTDKELLESSSLRGGAYGTYEDKRNNEDENGNKVSEVIGNYLRIIMRDKDDTVVENVEDYIDIDTGTIQSGDQEYQFRDGDLELLADAIHHECCGEGVGANDEEDLYISTSMGYTIINKLNSDSGYVNAAGMDWAPDKSPLYNIVCVVPCAAHGGNGWYAISDEGTMGGLKNRADAGQYEYCDLCMQAAEYIEQNDSMNFTNNGKFDTGFTKGEGMPHTVWEQGGYSTGGKVWAYCGDYLEDTAK